MRRSVRTILAAGTLAAATTVVAVPPAEAGFNTFFVTDGGDNGSVNQLRWAVEQAQADAGTSDVVVDQTVVTTITLTGGTIVHDDPSDGGLNIFGNGVTINAGTGGVIFQSDAALLSISEATIQGVTTGGFAAVQGNGDVTLDTVTVQDNTTSNGNAAGVSAGGGLLTMTDSTLDDNDSTSTLLNFGGGYANTVDITNSMITNNTASTTTSTAAGGLFASNGGTITGTTISGNSGTATMMSGTAVGGVFAGGSLSILDNSLVDSNHGNGPGNGGGVSVVTAGVTITESTINGNTTDGSGGGIDADTASTITRSTISGNSAAGPGGGGGINSQGSVTVENSTITENTAHEGAGITTDGSVSLRHSTVVENTTTSNLGTPTANVLTGAGDNLTTFGSVIADPMFTMATSANCSIGGTTTSNGYNFADDTTCDLTGTGDNQNASNDPMLGGLMNNGGPTETKLPQTGSPLINAVPSGSCDPMATPDQRGITRPQGTGCDIGSVEVAMAPPPTTSPPVCPASAALLPPAPTRGQAVLLLVGVGPFALLRLLRRPREARRVDRRMLTVAVLVGTALVVLAACVPGKVPPPTC